jgi:cytochrome c-type biogenesis protein CcmH
MRHLVLALLAFLAAAAPAQAVQPDEVMKDPALEQRARDISAGLRCLVCQNQSIDDSDAPLARDLRLLVRDRLNSGDTDAEVTDYIVDRYGEFVLLRPVLGAHTLLLWLTPLLVLGCGALGLVLTLRSRRSAAAASGLTEEEQQALARVLQEPDTSRPA